MHRQLLVLIAGLGAVLGPPALGQTSSSISTTPDGRLVGSASAGSAPPLSVEAGGGQTRAEGVMPRYGDGSGRSVTVQGPNGSASAGAWTSGGGQAAVQGSGSPGSDIRYRSYGRAESYEYRRHSHPRHHHWRRRHRP